MTLLLATVLLWAIMANHYKAVKYQATVEKQVKTLQQEVNTHQTQQLNTLEQQTQDQQKQIQDLQTQVQARAAQKAQNAVLASAVHTVSSFVAPNAYAGSGGLGGDADKLFIYMHESGNVPCKINGGSVNCAGSNYLACGLGQALPCSKLLAACPDLSDYACQDNWWTNSYMIPRYGNWAHARAVWERQRWW